MEQRKFPHQALGKSLLTVTALALFFSEPVAFANPDASSGTLKVQQVNSSGLSDHDAAYLPLLNSVMTSTQPSLQASSHPETAFVQMIAGYYYSVGLRADGSVWTWGRNMFGELGLPNTGSVSSIEAPVRLLGITDIQSIASSRSGYQLGVKKDGTVWEWGSHRQPGTQPPRQLPALTDVKQAVTRSDISAAIKKDGSLWVWQRNLENGESGKPVRVKGIGSVQSVTFAGQFAFALDASQSIWAFEINQNEQGISIDAPIRLSRLPKSMSIESDSKHSTIYGIDRNGKAWKWSFDPYHPDLKQTGPWSRIYPDLNFVSIKASEGAAVLLSKQGEVWVHGKSPTLKSGKVQSLHNVAAIDAGGYHAFAIDANGRAWGWGGNKRHAIGVQRPPGGVLGSPVLLPSPITITINTRLLNTSFPAVMKEKRISIPLKDFVRALDGELTTNELINGTEGYLYTVRFGERYARFNLHSPQVEVDGRTVMLPSGAYIAPGAIMVPASLLAQLGFKVSWDPARQTIAIDNPHDEIAQ